MEARLSDHALRRLERSWRETGTAEAERAFRLAEVRAGVRTRASLADLAVLEVELVVGHRPTLALACARDPLLTRVPGAEIDRVQGPSDAYLRELVINLRRTTTVEVTSTSAVVRHELVGRVDLTSSNLIHGTTWIASDHLHCTAAAIQTQGILVEGEIGLVSAPAHYNAVCALREGYLGAGFRNGVRVTISHRQPHHESYQRAGTSAFHRIREAMAQTQVPWVRTPKGEIWPLAEIVSSREPWELFEWRSA